ncbi:hypothetical protein MMC10_002686 [Thelotrema lepadinum]|nr:hypothetical protein [Thelotrema lepadinum]
MRSTFLVSALAALGLAIAQPLEGRQAAQCGPVQKGTAPPTFIPADNVQSFQANLLYKVTVTLFNALCESTLMNQGFATVASLVPPSGYKTVFSDLSGATEGAGYMGYTFLSSYAPVQCANACNAITDCKAVNVFVERDPSSTPTANCTNPPSIANYKCSFWNATISASTATNKGQYQEQFQTAIAASDGFIKA